MSKMKKIVASFTTLACASMMMGMVVMPAQAITAEELQVQIDALLAQLTELQEQLADLGGDITPTVEGCEITSFDRNLSQGMTGDDVKCLQIVLNTASDTKLGDTGAGSPGNETSYFGPLTKAGVIKFQELYADEVLASWGLTSGTGYVGSTTRTKLNELLEGDVTPTGCDCTDWANVACGGGDCTATQMQQTRTCTPEEGAATDACDGVATTQCVADASCVVGAGLNVSLADDTPAMTSVPGGSANVPFTKVNFTAGTDGDVTITGLKVVRKGLSLDAAVSNVKLYDGSIQIGTSQSLGSNHKATFSNISINVPAGTTKTITLAATMIAASATYNGNIIQLSIDSASDITTTAAVTGTFPIIGNSMAYISTITIGTAVLYDGSSGTRNDSDLTVDPSEADIRFTQVKIMAGSAEGLKITQVTAIKNGTAATTDVKDLKLVNDTTGTTIGTLATLPADGKAVFSNLNIEVAKGGYVELSILASLVAGSGRTLTFDLWDGSAYTIDMVGITYGFGITPTCNNFCLTTYYCTPQTINQGYLTVSKSSKTPATGNIALGGSQEELAAFDFVAGGEGVNVTSTQVTLTAASSGRPIYYTNVTGYDDSGNALFGPQDCTTTTQNGNQNLTFTDSYSLPVGTTTVHIKANVASSYSTDTLTSTTVVVNLPASSITAKGATSGKTTYTTSSGTDVPPGTSAVTANTMTILGPALAVVTASVPIAGTIVISAQDAVFAYFDLDASASGEDVKVTTIKTTDTVTGGTTTYTGINNLELFDGDTKLETTNSTATNANIVTFTLRTPLRITAGTTERLALKADVVNNTASTTHTFKIANTTDHVVSTGWSTGSAIGETYTGTGQEQTIGSVGTLKITVSADRPAAAQFVAGATGNSMMEYRLYAVNEDITITNFYIATEGTRSGANVAKVKLYLDGDILGNSAGYTLDATNNGKKLISLTSGTLTVPKSTYKTLTMKVDLVDKISLTDADTVEVGLGDSDGDYSEWGANGAASSAGTIRYYMTANGVSSGTTIVNDGTSGWINSTATTAGTIAASYTQYLYDGVLVASLASGSPSGAQTAGANKEVMELDLEAVGDDITINEMEFCVAGTATVSGTGSLTIKSSDLGTTYATITQSGFDAYWDAVLSTSNTYTILDPTPTDANAYCFSVGDNSGALAHNDIVAFSTTLQIAEGTTKTIRIFGDTTGALTTLSIQLTLGPHSSSSYNATTSGIEWENNSAAVEIDSTLTKKLPVTGGSLIY